jgi:hypothetical protein
MNILKFLFPTFKCLETNIKKAKNSYKQKNISTILLPLYHIYFTLILHRKITIEQ